MKSLKVEIKHLDDFRISRKSNVPFHKFRYTSSNLRYKFEKKFRSINFDENFANLVQTIGEILERKTSVAQIMSRTVNGLNQSFSLRSSHPENVIFELFKVPNTNKEVASLTKLLKVRFKLSLR